MALLQEYVVPDEGYTYRVWFLGQQARAHATAHCLTAWVGRRRRFARAQTRTRLRRHAFLRVQAYRDSFLTRKHAHPRTLAQTVICSYKCTGRRAPARAASEARAMAAVTGGRVADGAALTPSIRALIDGARRAPPAFASMRNLAPTEAGEPA
eukprot:1122046-Pleurochrysis_carterae.AAC.3